MEKIGVYIHVPFCNQRCPYCDFYSKIADASKKDSYVKAVLFAMEHHPYGQQKADTLYFGGGTPTVLGADRLITILQKAKEIFQIDELAEITLEANPESTTLDGLKKLKAAGFNRISFGVQSMIPKELEALGRLHSATEAKLAILRAEEAGFQHISADLMLHIPYQTKESLAYSITQLTSLPLDHISAYMLIVEEDTPFATSPLLQACPPEEEQGEFYLQAIEQLAEAGFVQYEVSNFAKEHGKSIHNLKYWQTKPYLGIGPSAHSYINGQRFSMSPDLSAFIETQGDWKHMITDGSGGDWEEYAMLQLRLSPGLDLKVFHNLYPTVETNHMIEKAKKFEQEGLLTFKDHVITLTPQGFLFSNTITTELLY